TPPPRPRLARAREKIRAICNGDGELEAKVGPRPIGAGPTLLVGGYVEASIDRAARIGDGWTQGGSGPDAFTEDKEKLDEAWKKHGREGKPRTMALAYFSLGPNAEENARSSLLSYYAWLGDEAAEGIAGSAAKDADTVKGFISNYEQGGCDELIFFPSSSDPSQVGLLAEAVPL